MKISKLFTLIELIVVIAVLGILAAIIIPNISSFQDEANDTAIQSNVRNLQTSVDMYAMDNYGSVPTVEQPSENIPQPIDFGQIYPHNLRDLPETEGVNYWVDFNGKVWASTVDAPTGVEYDTVNLKWNGVDNAAYYNIFKTTNSITSSVDKKKMVFIKKVEDSRNEISISMPNLNGGEEYLVSAVDENTFESAPAGTGYTGYKNVLPIAIIGMTPSSNINTETIVSWDYAGSTDPDGDSIVNAEWQVDGNIVSNPPATFSAGNHTVKLRVKDEKGNWSSWRNTTFTVEEANQLPTAVISMNPSSGINVSTNISWGYNSSTDPDGDNISTAEWLVNGVSKTVPPTTLSAGSHTVKLRVQDSKGGWSSWVTKSFTVDNVVVSNGTEFIFTNAGASGRYGPNQSQLNSTYNNTNLDGKVTSSSGIQLWTVPETGTYRIETYGAQGGSDGGRGAIIKGDILLSQGQQLKILVGQQGTDGSGAGGGGGTFVAKSDNTPLVVSGGGGGRNTYSHSDANTSTDGKYGDGSIPGAGGTDGNGGQGGGGAGNSGGGGFYTNGTKGTYDSLYGYAFVNGGQGGYGADSANREKGAGGFGGGGGGNAGGHSGGAGGYSGGGGSGNGQSGSSGGGGSYIVSSATNISKTVSNTGHGKVVITKVN